MYKNKKEICVVIQINRKWTPRPYIPFTRVAFTIFVVLPEESVAVVTGDLLSRFDVP
jgi:hypothetical protein